MKDCLENMTGAGMSVSLFALRGRGGCGCGDLGNLPAVIDMAKLMGLSCVEVLYAMDFTPCGGTPLRPVYIDLNRLPGLANHSKDASYKAEAAALDKEPAFDYAKTYSIKMHYLGEVYRQQGRQVLSSDGYHAFWKENRDWLEQYAVFCTLRHKYGTGNNRYWSEPDYTRLLEDSHFLNEYSDDIRFHCYVQYLLYRQLAEVRDYARQAGIPIYVMDNGDLARSSGVGIPPSTRHWWFAMSDDNRNGSLPIPGLAGNAPQYLEPWIMEAFVRKRLSDTHGIAIYPLEDWLAVTTLTRNFSPELEIVNPPYDQPSTWHYRMDITVEEILSHRALLDCIRTIVTESVNN